MTFSRAAARLVIPGLLLAACSSGHNASTPSTVGTSITSTASTTTTGVTTTTSGGGAYPAYVVRAMMHTVEVDAPQEHFEPGGRTVSIPDGTGGRVEAVVGGHTPHADSAGQLVFFFHNGAFIGWDADQVAVEITGLAAAGPAAIAVTYANYASRDPVVDPSLPPATVVYRWNGHRIAANAAPPPGVYQLNDPGANAVRVQLVP